MIPNRTTRLWSTTGLMIGDLVTNIFIERIVFKIYFSGEPFLGLEAVVHWPGFESASEDNGHEHKQHFMFRTVTMLIGPDI